MSVQLRIGPRLNSIAETCVDALTDIVCQAAAAISSITPDSADAALKPDDTPVCKADVIAQAVIVDGLTRLWPDLPIVSEEATALSSSRRIGDDFVLVDPIDGTREFLARRAEFTINIGVVVKGVPAIGVIAAPALGTVWRGVVGYGAERLRIRPGAREAAEATTIKTRPRPAGGAVVATSRSHFDQRTAALLARLAITDRIACGSSIKFCRLAEGAADFYPRLGPVCEWDIAAGHAILVAAGGVVLSPSGERIAYGRVDQGFRLPGFLAFGDPSAAPEVVRAAAADVAAADRPT